MGNNALRELGRILLAQGGNGPNGGNVHANNNANYMNIHITALQKTYFENQTAQLRNHLLTNGHLGYFPLIRGLPIASRNFVKADLLIPRGIFYIDQAIINRVHNMQLILAGINYSPFLPNRNILGIPNLYNIDPLGIGNNTLFDTTKNLIFNIFCSNNINVINSQLQNNNNRFSITFSVNNPILIIGQNNIGENQHGNTTNTVKIVVQVLNGIVSIVTMYPI